MLGSSIQIGGSNSVLVSGSGVDIFASGDLDDYFSFSVTSNRPLFSATGNYLVLGKDATTGHSLDADDVLFGEDIEVDGVLYADGNVIGGSAIILGTNEGGDGSAAPVGNIIRASDIVGGTTSNVAGADITISAGLGTGTGDAGTIIFQLPEIVGAGSTIQTRATVLTMDMVASTTDMSFIFTPNTTVSSSGTLTIASHTRSGTIAGGDVPITAVGDMTFTAGSIIAAGATDTNTLLFKAGGLAGTTFITLTSNATDVCTINENIAVDAGKTIDGVDISAHAADIDAHMTDLFQTVRTGEYFQPLPIYAKSTLALTADTIYAIPFFVARSMTIDRLAIDVAVAAAGGAIARLGIYADGTNLYPGALVVDAGTVAVDAVAVVAATISQALTKGWYWLVVVSDNTPTLDTHAPDWSPLGWNAASFSTSSVYTNWVKAAVTSGALADPFAAGATLTAGGYPAVLPRLLTLD